MSRRVGVAQLWQEVNTYSPRPTGLTEFEAMELLEGSAIFERHAGTRSVVAGFMERKELDLIPLFSAGAWPAGPPDETTVNRLLEGLERSVRAEPGLDGILLNLHGAMVGEGHPDMELDAVRVIREALGDVPVGCVLDLHGIPSPEFVEELSVLVGYDTYPHVDMLERGHEAAALLDHHLGGGGLSCGVAKVPMLTSPLAQATGDEPMASLMAHARSIAAADGVRRVSLLPGFPYSDVDRVGFSLVGVADSGGEEALGGLLDELAAEVERRRREFELHRPSPHDAVELALAEGEGPVVIADVADNVGGGGAGDGTALLQELLAQGAEDAIVTLADAEVAAAAAAAGPGERIRVSVGAKLDDRHGSPVEAEAEVVAITDGRYVSRGTYLTGQQFSSGTTAHLRMEGVDLVVTEMAVPPYHAEQVTQTGLKPGDASVITAKGAVAWRSAFGDVARKVIEADTPGVTPLHPEVLPRTVEPRAARASDWLAGRGSGGEG